MTFDEIYNFVVPKNFGVSLYAGNVLISNGVKCALENKAIASEQVQKAIALFESGDFGDAYECGERPIKGNEYGEYKTGLTPGSGRGNLWVHRESSNIVVYFHFER